jgi:hypothetical protein
MHEGSIDMEGRLERPIIKPHFKTGTHVPSSALGNSLHASACLALIRRELNSNANGTCRQDCNRCRI